MRNRFSTRTLVAGGAAIVLVVVAFLVIANRQTPDDRLRTSVDAAAERVDSLESDVDALQSALPSTTAPPPTFLSTTTTSTSLVRLLTTTTSTTQPTLELHPASREQIEAVVTGGVWDFQLPIPAEGIETAGYAPSDNGGTFSMTVPAAVRDVGAFYDQQLNARGFQFTRDGGDAQITYRLGSQGTVSIAGSGTTSSLTITIAL